MSEELKNRFKNGMTPDENDYGVLIDKAYEETDLSEYIKTTEVDSKIDIVNDNIENEINNIREEIPSTNICTHNLYSVSTAKLRSADEDTASIDVDLERGRISSTSNTFYIDNTTYNLGPGKYKLRIDKVSNTTLDNSVGLSAEGKKSGKVSTLIGVDVNPTKSGKVMSFEITEEQFRDDGYHNLRFLTSGTASNVNLEGIMLVKDVDEVGPYSPSLVDRDYITNTDIVSMTASDGK